MANDKNLQKVVQMLNLFLSLCIQANLNSKSRHNIPVDSLQQEINEKEDELEITNSPEVAEIVGGSPKEVKFTTSTYIGLVLVLLILIVFLVWKYFSTRKHSPGGEANVQLTPEAISHIKPEDNTDKIKIEIDENSESDEEKLPSVEV